MFGEPSQLVSSDPSGCLQIKKQCGVVRMRLDQEATEALLSDDEGSTVVANQYCQLNYLFGSALITEDGRRAKS